MKKNKTLLNFRFKKMDIVSFFGNHKENNNKQYARVINIFYQGREYVFTNNIKDSKVWGSKPVQLGLRILLDYTRIRIRPPRKKLDPDPTFQNKKPGPDPTF